MAWRTADPEEWIAASNENGDSGNIPRKYTVPFLTTPVTVKATAGFEGEEDMEITCKGAHFEAQVPKRLHRRRRGTRVPVSSGGGPLQLRSVPVPWG